MDDDKQREEVIQPRTRKERRAYVEGYLDALHTMQTEGMLTAVSWAAELAEMEGLKPAQSGQEGTRPL